MTAAGWAGIAFLVIMIVLGGVALYATLRSIRDSELDEQSKGRWGLLIGLSPGAGLYAWHRRDELMGHGDSNEEQLLDDEQTPPH